MGVIASKVGKTMLAIGVMGGLAACDSPGAGPRKNDILRLEKPAMQEKTGIFVVPVTPSVTQATANTPAFGFSEEFRQIDIVDSEIIAPGDVIGVTVYENVQEDPLLGMSGQRISTLEEIVVDARGRIFMPYVGELKAQGQTPTELRATITAALGSQTPDPQVLVRRLAGDGTTITIQGAAANGVFPIERSTRMLSAMIAFAGGVTTEPENTVIHVLRGDQKGTIWYSDLISDPKQDIALRAGDRIVIEKDTRAFLALGAAGGQERVVFETPTLSALEAIARVGGLNGSLADPAGVFVFRDEAAEVANAVLNRSDLQGEQRVIYVLDLSKPASMFEARSFAIRADDTIYVAEANSIRRSKTFTTVNGTINTLVDTANKLK